MEACRQAATWHRQGHPIGMSVNISRRQLESDVDLVADVQAALRAGGLDPGALTLEITESMLMQDVERGKASLNALKDLGVRLAIDDFGAGYSSLAYLQQFPVDVLKIDRCFIAGIDNSPRSDALIHTLVQLGKSIGIQTVGEGIEVNTQLERLQLEECDSGQGYLFGRPMPPAEIEALLATQSASLSSPGK
jgi:EAL domain-containing protein (putative c-di-GMP-specific phosphodiesterase class I)